MRWWCPITVLWFHKCLNFALGCLTMKCLNDRVTGCGIIGRAISIYIDRSPVFELKRGRAARENLACIINNYHEKLILPKEKLTLPKWTSKAVPTVIMRFIIVFRG